MTLQKWKWYDGLCYPVLVRRLLKFQIGHVCVLSVSRLWMVMQSATDVKKGPSFMLSDLPKRPASCQYVFVVPKGSGVASLLITLSLSRSRSRSIARARFFFFARSLSRAVSLARACAGMSPTTQAIFCKARIYMFVWMCAYACVCSYLSQRERESEKVKREKERESKREMKWERGKKTDRERERQRERDKERDRDRERQRETERDRERQREAERDGERQRETERDRGGEETTMRSPGGEMKTVLECTTASIHQFLSSNHRQPTCYESIKSIILVQPRPKTLFLNKPPYFLFSCMIVTGAHHGGSFFRWSSLRACKRDGERRRETERDRERRK